MLKGFVVVERAVYAPVPVGLDTVVVQDREDTELRFDLGYFHFSTTFMVSVPLPGSILTKSPMLNPKSCNHKPSSVSTGASLTLLCDLHNRIFRSFCFDMEKV